jgi:Mg2+-importing ATPase
MYFSKFTNKNVKQLAQLLHVSFRDGLRAKDADSRLSKYGENILTAENVTWWRILLRQFHSSFLYLLLAAAVLSFLFDEAVNGFFILAFIGINVGLGFYQEFRSENTLSLLKRYVVAKSKVRRDIKEEMIESRFLVPGDIVILQAGDVIPADVRFIDTVEVQVEESTLTGESVSVRKSAKAMVRESREIFEAKNVGFMGTNLVSGKATAVVIATGKNSVFGGISHLTTSTQRVSSFEKGMNSISRFVIQLVLLTLTFVYFANILVKGGDVSLSELLIFSIALAVSVIPEGLQTVTTFSLSHGASRLAKKHVIVKRLSAVEDFGGIDVLCTDKTGTLTQDNMSVADVLLFRSDRETLLFYGKIGAYLKPMVVGERVNDFDRALQKVPSSKFKERSKNYRFVSLLPFDPERRSDAGVVKTGKTNILIVRGAPEVVWKRCGNIKEKDRKDLETWMDQQGKVAHRVMAIAMKRLKCAFHDASFEEDNLLFVGCVAFMDPLKSTATETISRAKSLGVNIKILTGDRPEVAGAVAREVGLIENPSFVMTGAELMAESSKAQEDLVERYTVFARVTPEQKYHIIQLLQKKHEVGYLGEGMNDAPALRIANVGVVVDGASDIGREAADIVLLRKSLRVIIDGIEEGRKVFANMVKYIQATLASNFGNFFAVALATLVIDFLPMLPIQILLVNLLSDFPMMAIATDTVDGADLRRPKSYHIKEIALFAIVLGAVSTVFDFIYFGLFYRLSPPVLQTNWFMASIITELFFLFSVRTKLPFFAAKRPSHILSFLSLLGIGITIVLPFTRLGQSFFSFVPPSSSHLFLIIGLVLVYFFVTEVTKLMYYHYTNHEETA